MAFRKTRDTVEHDQSVETEMEGGIREFVRRDVVTNLATSRRKIDVFGPLVNGGGKAKPAGWPAGGGGSG